MTATYNSENITEKRKVREKGLTSLTLANHGTTDVLFTITNVTRTLPAFDPLVHLAPPKFDIDGDGFPFEIEMTVDFATKVGGLAIMDYRKTKEC
ncbi:hypothetical protein MH928_17280 [Flavobacterium sp. WW92]|uniref:hypothetical protein n=1 Tax=unclassified Flavobacterium TaxID=196869 RepID=UPI002223F978|nr:MULTISPECIES: hypothetical protein [unclassified Flavobacterium]WDO13061.1 hypothetical protein MH928_17280 [Flavobacterium sp. WW92]